MLRRTRTIHNQVLSTIIVIASLASLGTSPAGAIENGAIDADTPLANASIRTVYEFPPGHRLFDTNTSGCSGTLITPTMVLAAGHCIGRADVFERSNLRCGRSTGDTTTEPIRPDELPAQWYRFNRGEEKRWIQFGRDFEIFLGQSPETTDHIYTYSEYAQPVCYDMIVLRLDEPVPPEVAVPVKVLTSLGNKPGTEAVEEFFQGKTFTVTGWGKNTEGIAPNSRQRASLIYASKGLTQVTLTGVGGAQTRLGDSGAPLYWDSPSGQRYVVAVNQKTGNLFTPTFNGPTLNRPDIGWFFETVVPDAVTCDTVADRPEGTVALTGWFSPEREDNFATAQRTWIGCDATVRSPDYEYRRIEGYIFNPNLPQPEGTVAIYSWFDRNRGDNLLGGGSVWSYWVGGGRSRSPGYTMSRLEGYVFDPARPQPPGTVHLQRWYSSSGQDNWTTTDQEAPGPDYSFSRIVGFVYPAE